MCFCFSLSLLNFESLLTKEINAQVRRPPVRTDDREDNKKFVFFHTDVFRASPPSEPAPRTDSAVKNNLQGARHNMEMKVKIKM